MRALRREALPRLDLRTTGMEFASEMVIRASKEQLDIRKLPIEYHPRGGESKLSSFRDGWRPRYTLWLRGSIGRQVRVLVDGEEVGSLRWQQSYPQQYAPVGTVELPAGVHTFEIARGGGTLLPGTSNVSADGFTTTVGPLAFAFSQPGPRVSYAQPGEFGEMCRSEVGLDWVEVLAPPAPGQETGDDEAT
jgi:hypothetical protein